ncbi:MAG: aminotransferase class I/II-fold pyridoxal phosphate-dependent enzyme, partial [Spirochaetota bacterium]
DDHVMGAGLLGCVTAPAHPRRGVAAILESKAGVASYERRGAILAEGLRAAGYAFPDPQGAFHIVARVPARKAGKLEEPSPTVLDDVEFAMHLKSFHILAVPGIGFGCPGWFRLSFCVPERTIRDAIPAFARAMASWQGA